MVCETCQSPHDGSYGSGRFCSAKCARAFSTKAKRADINAAVSTKMAGRPSPHRGKQMSTPRSETHRRNLSQAALAADLPWRKTKEDLLAYKLIKGGGRLRRSHVAPFKDLTRCEECGQGDQWNGKTLTMQIDHVNGDPTDHRLENLKVLCPNCHTQTPTWGFKKRT